MICFMKKTIVARFSFPRFIAPEPGTLVVFMDTDKKTRDEMVLNGLGLTKV